MIDRRRAARSGRSTSLLTLNDKILFSAALRSRAHGQIQFHDVDIIAQDLSGKFDNMHVMSE